MPLDVYSFLNEFLICFTAVFVAINPLGIVPIFMSLTQSLSPQERQATVKTSAMVAFIVAMVFLFLGTHLFKLMGLTVLDFKVAGGLVIMLVALSDLLKGPQGLMPITGSTGIVPLAVPLLTGPGVITTVVLQASNSGYLIVVLSLIINFFLAWLLLSRGQKVSEIIGKDGTVIVSKIAALLLAALGFAMIRTGLVDILAKKPIV
jgi:multiple antibiotic resistance protein